ncbi:MAG: hypothetical protein NVSMB23_03720 [Myxococcales bacterium]
MDLSFLPLTLPAVDKVSAESLCLFVGEDERPLTGLAGLADWRLAGGLSRLLRAGLLKGTEGEALLTPARRMPFGKLFLFGLGPLDQGEEQLGARVAAAIAKLASAGVGETALQLPQRLSPEAGIRILVDVVTPSKAIVFAADPAALVRALSQVANRGAAPVPERRVVKVPGPPPRSPLPHRPGPPDRPPAPRAQPLEVPRAAPLPFTPSNAQVIRPRTTEAEVASARDPQADAPIPSANLAAAPPTAAPAPEAAASTSPSPPGVGAQAAPPAAPAPAEGVRPPPPRLPLPKTQRYVPPEPRPGRKKP